MNELGLFAEAPKIIKVYRQESVSWIECHCRRRKIEFMTSPSYQPLSGFEIKLATSQKQFQAVRQAFNTRNAKTQSDD